MNNLISFTFNTKDTACQHVEQTKRIQQNPQTCTNYREIWGYRKGYILFHHNSSILIITHYL